MDLVIFNEQYKKRTIKCNFVGTAMKPNLISTITCPFCFFAEEKTMETDSCLFFYQCPNCKSTLKPKEGDCCVFCSYGTEKCPAIQLGSNCCK